MYLEQLIEKYVDWRDHSDGVENAVVEEVLDDLRELARLGRMT